MSAIFLLPVCLTYWPRKYTRRVDAYVDNSHQVWSWYDHTLPSCSVFVCWHVTWPCDLEVCSFDLENLSFMATGESRFQLCHQVWRPYAYPHLWSLSATFVLRMRRNGYLWTSGVNLDTADRFANSDFMLECNISAIWRRFPLIFLHFIFWMSAIFLLPVCLTYWPRKYTTGVDPQVDNSHQVWSWYDNPMRSYSVFVWWYVTWPRDIDLWPFDLEQLQYITGQVSNHVTNFEDPLTIRSWVASYNVFHWLP